MAHHVNQPATYLDWNATAPALPEAITAMEQAMQGWANPSSVHAAGRRAKAALEGHRRSISAALGVMPDALIFTSGGSEAVGLALGQARTQSSIISAVEHDAVRAQAVGAHIVPVDAQGLVDMEALDALLIDVDGPPLVAVMHANNETGVIQPIAAIAEKVWAAEGLLLVDCVQTAGKLPLPSCDFAAVSAHKLGGAPGVGALIVRCLDNLHAVSRGGGQERGYRAGTENLPGIAAFAAALAVRHADKSWLVRVEKLRDAMEARMREIAPDVEIAGTGAPRLPTTSAVRLPGLVASTQLIAMDMAGVQVSSGAACSSGKVRASHVLQAMGWDAQAAQETIRISLGPTTSEDDIARALAVWEKLARQRQRR